MKRLTLIYAAVILVSAVVVFSAGYFSSDGEPDIYNLEESEGDAIRNSEQSSCNREIKTIARDHTIQLKQCEKDKERFFELVQDNFEICSDLSEVVNDFNDSLSTQITTVSTKVDDLNKTISNKNIFDYNCMEV